MGVLHYLSLAIVIPAAQASDAIDCTARGSAKDIAAGHNLTGKVAFLTGSDTGVGYETALALARQGASIIIANHNAASGQAAVENITRITGNTKVEALELDLASFDSCRKVADQVNKKVNGILDFMIMDAGVETPRGITKDGFEYVMQVNYLGHFLLEQLLLPALRASEGGKVIAVSSIMSFYPCSPVYPANCTDMESIAFLTTYNTTVSNYDLTKFMMVYNIRELARREAGSKVRAFAIRPGLVDTPLTRRTMPEKVKDYLCSPPQCASGFRGLGCDTPCPMPPSAGANSPTYIAVTDNLSNGNFYAYCKVIQPPAWAHAATNQAMLYDMSLKLTGTASKSEIATFV